ncbi:MAG: hypothetical protein OXF45_05160 [Candidatus Dadabacteria bacterium]|nr:hypothetical protein [Candidatus Dadabacteria bacterium]
MKFSYILEKGLESDEIFDAIFQDSYRRWGGRNTLIIPINNGLIEEPYIRWLEWYDPDVIYTYSEISQNSFKNLLQQTSPLLFLQHNKPKERDYWSKPEYGLNPVSSLSTIPYVNKINKSTDLPVIITQSSRPA